MNSIVFKIIAGYVMVFTGWLVNMISQLTHGIVDKGFDAGLSIGLLIVGLIVLGWYHWKYQQYSRKIISSLAHDKDQKTADYHQLVIQQIELSKDQIQTNKELRDVIKGLSNQIERIERVSIKE